MAQKQKNPKRLLTRYPRQTAQADQIAAELKVRVPERLRADIERAAARNGRSMNHEIIKRLDESFHETNKTQLIANALVKELDADILAAMFHKVLAEGILSESLKGIAKPGSIKGAATLSKALTTMASLNDKPLDLSNLPNVLKFLQSLSVTSSTTPTAPPVHDDEDSDDRPHSTPR